MALIFDYYNQIIHVESPQTDVLCQDLINDIRTAEAEMGLGMAHTKIADATGKADLGGGVQVGITVDLLESWQIKFWAGSYIAKISGGNLVGGPGNDPVAYTAGVQVLLIQSASSTIIDLDLDDMASQTTLLEVQTDMATQASLLEVLGLVNKNAYIDQTVFDGDGNLTSARVRIYSDKASVGTVNDVIETYTITAVGDGAGKFTSWKQVVV